MRRLSALALIAALLFASVTLTLWRWRHVPRDDELAAAGSFVREGFRQGDLIVAEPPWMSAPRTLLGDLPLWQPRHLVREDLVGVDRVWLVQIDSIGGALGVAQTVLGMGATVTARDFGSARVALVELADGARLVFDLRDGLEAVTVTARYPDGIEARCERFDGDRWACPRDPAWSYVGRETLDIDGQPRDCVWMHPVAAGGTLSIELPPLPPLAAARLDAAFGFTADASRRAAAPVLVSVRVGDTVLAEETLPVALGWRRLSVPLSSVDGRLAIVLSSTNNGAAHFCGAVRVLEEGG